MPEQSERQYNLFWMIRMSPFADYTDEQIQEAIERKIREVNRTLKTQPVEMVRAKSERKVAKLESLSGNREAIEEERDQAILHFNRNMGGPHRRREDRRHHRQGGLGRRHRTGQGRRHAPLPHMRLHQQEDQALRQLQRQTQVLNRSGGAVATVTSGSIYLSTVDGQTSDVDCPLPEETIMVCPGVSPG